MARAEHRNDDEYGLAEEDFRQDDRGRGNDRELDPVDRRLDDDELEVDDHSPQYAEEVQPVEKQKSFIQRNWVYIGVVAGGIALFAGLAWFVLGHSKPPAPKRSAPEPFAAQVPNQPKQQGAQQYIEPIRLDNHASAPALEAAPAVAQRQDEDLEDAAPITQRTQQEQDDVFYDNIVKAASDNAAANNQPQAATEIPHETDAKLAALSQAIADRGKEMGDILNAVKVLSEDVKSLRKQVDASSAKSDSFEGKLNLLTTGLDDLSKKTEARFKEVSQNAVTAALAAVNKGQKPNDKLVLVGGRVTPVERPTKKVAPSAPQPKPAPAVAVSPVRAVPETVTAKPENKGNQGQQCRAHTVSQNWKVKGITTTGAYVRRNDGKANMLRVDDEVPGFGQVVSFDPVSRTVCTTSGLIAR